MKEAPIPKHTPYVMNKTGILVANEESSKPKVQRSNPVMDTWLGGTTSHRTLLKGLNKKVAPKAKEPSHAIK